MCRDKWWRSRKYSWQIGHVSFSSRLLLLWDSVEEYSFLWCDRMWKTKSDVMRKDRLHLAHQFWAATPNDVKVGGRRVKEEEEEEEEVVLVFCNCPPACLGHRSEVYGKTLLRVMLVCSIWALHKSLTKNLELRRVLQHMMSVVAMKPDSSPRLFGDSVMGWEEFIAALSARHLLGLLKALFCSPRALVGHTKENALPEEFSNTSFDTCSLPAGTVSSSSSDSLGFSFLIFSFTLLTSVKALCFCSKASFLADCLPELGFQKEPASARSPPTSSLPPQLRPSLRLFVFSNNTVFLLLLFSASSSFALFSPVRPWASSLWAVILTSRSLARLWKFVVWSSKLPFSVLPSWKFLHSRALFSGPHRKRTWERYECSHLKTWLHSWHLSSAETDNKWWVLQS